MAYPLEQIPVRLKDDPTVTRTLARRSLLAWGHMWEPIPADDDSDAPDTEDRDAPATATPPAEPGTEPTPSPISKPRRAASTSKE
jgi:hypothetical protein